MNPCGRDQRLTGDGEQQGLMGSGGGPLTATRLMEPDRQYQVSNMVSAAEEERRRNHSERETLRRRRRIKGWKRSGGEGQRGGDEEGERGGR